MCRARVPASNGDQHDLIYNGSTYRCLPLVPQMGQDHGVGWRVKSPLPTYRNPMAGGGASGIPWWTTTVGSPARSAKTNGRRPSPNKACRSTFRRWAVQGWPDGIEAASANASLGDVVQSAASGPTSAKRCASCLSKLVELGEGPPSPPSGMLVLANK